MHTPYHMPKRHPGVRWIAHLGRSFSQLVQPGEIPFQTSNSACICIQILNKIMDYVLQTCKHQSLSFE